VRAKTYKSSDCSGPIHPEAINGMDLFNAGEYWLAHEGLEKAWKEESGPVRDLYRGILQVAVIYLHITHTNYYGAIKVHQRVQKWINPWPTTCRGIEIGRLRRDMETVIGEVRRLGPEQLSDFDYSLLKPIQWM
jgi:hypothetical protein